MTDCARTVSSGRRHPHRILAGVALLFWVAHAALHAQGVTGAAIQGRVLGGDSLALEGATIVITNAATGERWRTTSAGDGRYGFERLSVGGPYGLEVRAIGFAPAAVEDLVVALGERRTVDVPMSPAALRLAPLEVHAARPPPGGGTGPSRTIGEEQIAHLPLLNRDVLDLVREAPQAVGGVFGISIGGQGPLQNSFQVDGGENTSLYGQFSATPGGLINLLSPPGGGGLRTVALDAVQEIQVLVAPFDVRQGSFTGGLINAVTKSGTNAVHGSGFVSLQNQWLAGRDLEGHSLSDFHTVQFGGTAGGPIVRDRLHFFLATDLQASLTPYGGPLIRSDTAGGRDSAGVGIRHASAVRFQRILEDTYGVMPGGFGIVDTRNPAQSLFGKLTLQAGVNSRVEVSQSYVHGADRGFLLNRERHGSYGLTSTDGAITSTTTATRATWNTLVGQRGSNELIVAELRIRDRCTPAAVFPFVRVGTDSGVLEAGRKPECSGATLAQNELELTDNLVMHFGAHTMVVGSHDELLKFNDPTTLGSGGAWEFASLDSLAAGLPASYLRSTTGPLRAEGPIADFRVHQLGVYVQDEWSPDSRLTITGGLRMDVPLFPDQPVRNPDLLNALGIDTGRFPNGHPLWSPRLGVSYTPGGSAIALRAGAGLFTGRPPYFLPADAYRSTGLEQFLVSCAGDDVPGFTLDPARQPGACSSSGALPVPRVTFVDRSFRFPQELKLSAGLDAALPGGLQAIMDVLVSRSHHQADLVDVNLAPTGAALAGEGGRVLYGTLDFLGTATPNRRTNGFTSVVRQANGSGNHHASLSLSLVKQVGGHGELSASYAYSESWDRMDPPGGLGISLSGLGVAADQIGGTALDGTLEHRRLARSVYDVPHKLRLSGTIAFPLKTALSVIYEGSSGSPFTYVVDGDINADGFGPELFGQQSNDIVYVPLEAAPGGDIALLATDGLSATAAEYGTLERFIAREPCLATQRGRIMGRNTCRNAWQARLDVRLAKTIEAGGDRALELTLDVFNLSHLLDHDWGLVRRTADFGLEEVPLLQLVGFDVARQRGMYQLHLPARRHVDLDASRWRMQLGARWSF
ncbi:MAG: TonB-dependent receptor domain-containing protein [Gemmatimonadales bacterium]